MGTLSKPSTAKCTVEHYYPTGGKYHSALRRPRRSAARIGHDQQEIVNLIVLETVSHLFCIGQRQLPRSHGCFADESCPTPGITATGANDALARTPHHSAHRCGLILGG